MTETPVTRRLAAILAADVVGYSRMMGADEAGTLAAVGAMWREVFNPTVAAHRGRIVEMMGDGALVEFASVVESVNCALAIQKLMAERNARQPDKKPVELSIGVNLGDIIIEGDDIFGDGVNVAARIEGQAPPGGVRVRGFSPIRIAQTPHTLSLLPPGRGDELHSGAMVDEPRGLLCTSEFGGAGPRSVSPLAVGRGDS